MTAAAKSSDAITPAVHLEFIQNQLESAGASGEEIEAYHRSLFLHHHAIEWEKHRQDARIHEERLCFLEGRLKQAQLGLSERQKFVAVSVDGREDSAPTQPWNGWDLFMFILAALGAVALIGFGVFNISFNLLESGFVTFRQNPIRSYLWAALLPVGALAIKVGWDFLHERRQRAIYFWTCLALGILGVTVWAGAYACVYPTLSKGIDEQISALTVFDGPAQPAGSSARLNFAGAKWVDVITVAAQATAEIFLSAVLGMYLTSLYARHRPVRLAYDPTFAQLDQERRDLEASVARERTALGQANGNILRLENQLSALIAYGKSTFHREAAKRQNQSEKRQVILDQLSDHLRHHLEAADGNHRLSGTAARSGNGNSAAA
ncbi:MAG TPA: hypothetical protein VFE51_07920 [Verrucomicrobiae bacterium]|nr:hypothetical protein [Verrucomicrobiae bacterium]